MCPSHWQAAADPYEYNQGNQLTLDTSIFASSFTASYNAIMSHWHDLNILWNSAQSGLKESELCKLVGAGFNHIQEVLSQ